MNDPVTLEVRDRVALPHAQPPRGRQRARPGPRSTPSATPPRAWTTATTSAPCSSPAPARTSASAATCASCTTPATTSPTPSTASRSTMHAGIEALAALDAPVISVVRGAAAGGGMSIAIAADLVLAAESAHFTVAYTAIGFSTDGGASWTLPRLVGQRRAMELALLNERLSAARAHELGHRHPGGARRRSSTPRPRRSAQRLANGPIGAHGAVKRLLRGSSTTHLRPRSSRTRRTRSPGWRPRPTAARAFWRFWTSVRHTSESHEFNGPHPGRRSRAHRQRRDDARAPRPSAPRRRSPRPARRSSARARSCCW